MIAKTTKAYEGVGYYIRLHELKWVLFHAEFSSQPYVVRKLRHVADMLTAERTRVEDKLRRM